MKQMIVLAMLSVAGCATPPEKIAAVQMSGAEYAALGCKELAAAKAHAEMTVGNVSKQQSTIATNDAVGVALLGVPMGSIGGDLETSVAVEKGRLAAISRVMMEKGC